MLRILSQKYSTQTRPAESIDKVRACVGEKITVITDVYSEIITVASTDNSVWVKPPIYLLRVTADNSNAFFFDDTEFIAGLAVGDTFELIDTTNPLSPVNGDYTVLEKVTAQIIRVEEDLSLVSEGSRIGGDGGDDGYVVNTTPFKFAQVSFGVTKGGYLNPTTNQLQIANIIASSALSDATLSTMRNVGGLEWQSGNSTLLGEGQGYGSQNIIRITNQFFINPFFLSTELDDLLARKAPDFWDEPQNIKYRDEYIYAKNSLEILESNKIVGKEVGEFCWFDKRVDNTTPDYELISLQLEKVSDSSAVDALEFENEVEIVAEIRKKNGNLVVNVTGDIVVFGFNYLPQDESYYIENNKTLTNNFIVDTIRMDLVNGIEDGDNLTNPNQVIKTGLIENISADTIRLTVRISFGNESLSNLRQGAEAWYNIWVICEDISINAPLTNKSSLLLQTQKVHEQLITVDLFDNETVFIEHPYEFSFFGKETLEMFPADDVIANSLLQLDYTGKEADNIKIVSIEPTLQLTHNTEASIVLERSFINCENYDTVGLLPSLQDINYAQDREYKLPNGDLRKTIVFGRDYENDLGAVKAWALNYPFMNRWDYWNKLEGVNNIPTALFNQDLAHKGINQLWNRLANVAGWGVDFITKITIEQNGVRFVQEFTNSLLSQDFNTNTDWINCTIKSYDLDDNELIVSPNRFLQKGQKTKIIASFEKAAEPLPAIGNIAIVIWIMRFEAGSPADITRYSSVYEDDGTSQFLPINTEKIVTLSKTGAVYTGSCFVNNLKLPENTSKMTVYARIYEVSDEEFNVRVANDDAIRYIMNEAARQAI